MIIAFDLDDTLCKGTLPWPDDPDNNQDKVEEFFDTCEPIPEAIQLVNKLYEEGNTIYIWTARYQQDGWVTTQWLIRHRVKYHRLILGKLRVDVYIDNQSFRLKEGPNDSLLFWWRGQLDSLSLSEKT